MDGSSKNMKKVVLLHVTGIVGGLLFFRYIWYCPMLLFFHIPCPCCGMTRAFLALCRLDLRESFFWHPLLIPAGILILYVAHRRVLPKRLNQRTEQIIGIAFLAILMLVYVYRMSQGDLLL